MHPTRLRERLEPHFARLAAGHHDDPAAVLGWHVLDDEAVFAAYLPAATGAVLDGRLPLARWRDSPVFAWAGAAAAIDRHSRIEWTDAAGNRHALRDPYAMPLLSPGEAFERFRAGIGHDAARLFGAHAATVAGVAGTRFAVYAPRARSVALAIEGIRWPMRPVAGGAWELFLPGTAPGASYQFEIRAMGAAGAIPKTDPFGVGFDATSRRMARVPEPSRFRWNDATWMARRATTAPRSAPLSVYELHLGSWRRPGGRPPNYREIAPRLAEHVASLGFTHVELMPLAEHPHEDSWGYQLTGLFAPTSRYGTPDDLRALVDHLHQRGIGVLLDWVPGHFAPDDHGLARFDGAPLYEHADPRRSELPGWGTYAFDFERPETRSLLLASADFWMREFHFDGLRVDAVASMLRLDYDRAPDAWLANADGGSDNPAAAGFLAELNDWLHGAFPGAITCAEDSSAWPGLTQPTSAGGLGFDFTWSLGWMHDTLVYFAEDPLFRRHHHDRLFAPLARRREPGELLPLSHDEVVHGKRSLLGRMPGDEWQRHANLRLLLAWQWLHPGRKLLFMGAEFGDPDEWDHRAELPWPARDAPAQAGIRLLIADLNALYRTQSTLHATDDARDALLWIEATDHLRSVAAFERRGADSIVVVCNFTPVPRFGYRLGLPTGGAWREALNTDAECYGGTNLGNWGRVDAIRDPATGRPYSASLTLPPLAAIVLVKEGPAAGPVDP